MKPTSFSTDSGISVHGSNNGGRASSGRSHGFAGALGAVDSIAAAVTVPAAGSPSSPSTQPANTGSTASNPPRLRVVVLTS